MSNTKTTRELVIEHKEKLQAIRSQHEMNSWFKKNIIGRKKEEEFKNFKQSLSEVCEVNFDELPKQVVVKEVSNIKKPNDQ